MLLSLSSQEAARRIAIGLCRDASAAAERVRTRADAEALHDLRVALRRLRSVVRAFREPLAGSLRGKDRRSLRALAAGTGTARDAEVQLAWATDLLDGSLEPEERVAVTFLRDRWALRAKEAFARVDAEVLPGLATLLPRLERRLGTYVTEHRVFSDDARAHTLGALVARLAEAEMSELAEKLRRVATLDDEALAHEARIHGKRLRYLLEPFRAERVEAETTVATLRKLQELLGDLNDRAVRTTEISDALEALATSHVRSLVREALDEWAETGDDVRAEQVQPGLLALLRHEGTRKAETFSSILEVWRDGGGLERLEREVGALAQGLAGPTAPGGPPVEIERKFLLQALPPAARAAPSKVIEQGYLPGTQLIERVRKTVTESGERYFRTVKLGAGITRIEVEEECDRAVFSKLWLLTRGRRVKKVRYAVAEGGLVWEIDAFTDRKLFLAEVELPSADVVVTPPDWLAPYVVRDVTDEATYVNARLAK